MRIVGGKWRGKPFDAPSGRDVTRPTTDRVREAMASLVLSAYDLDLSGVSVLDAFAGSGAIGLELVSRGAGSVTLVDSDRRNAQLLRANVSGLGASSQARVVCGDAFRLAASGRMPGAPFGVVALDPPYATDAGQVGALVDSLATAGLLADGCLVLYERSSGSPELSLSCGSRVVKQKRYGTTCVDLLRIEGVRG